MQFINTLTVLALVVASFALIVVCRCCMPPVRTAAV